MDVTAVRLAVCVLVASFGAACSTAVDSGGGPVAAIPSPPHRAVCADVAGQMRCHAHVRTDEAGNAVRSATPGGLAPSDLRSAYALPASGGAGKTIAIVDAYDDPTAESDLAQYRSQYGLPPCTTANGCFRKVNEQGKTAPLPAANTGWSSEISVDLDMASAVCPACSILLVEADGASITDLGTSVNTAVALGASVVSNSYGGSEGSGITQIDALYYRHPGVLITVSSGDGGFGVQYPASSAYVTAVGGTSLARGGGARGWTETAWSGAGSGCSAFIAKPGWQHDAGCATRMVADVAAVADPGTGVAVFDQGAWAIYGGTSVASPVVAGIYAVTGNGAADGSYSYAHMGFSYDTTQGSNGTCTQSYECIAGPGYDGPTGNGTPNGADMIGASGDAGSGDGAGGEGGSGDGGTSDGGSSGNLLANGGFEEGLADWMVNAGPSVTESTQVHGGHWAAQVGTRGAYDGYSLIEQELSVPKTGTTTLTFWDYLVCEGTPAHEWQQAKIVDVLDRALVTVFRECGSSTSWEERTVDLTPWKGRTVYVQFGAHDDGHAGDPTWWYVDDVVVVNR